MAFTPSRTPTPDKPTICILYGLCEGRHVGRKFEQAASAAGLQVIRDAAAADIIVGHSGGCFALPAKSRAKLIVLIGLPYWPGKSILRGVVEKVIMDMRSHRGRASVQLLRKTCWNIIYFWNMANNRRMWRGQRSGACWQTTARAVLVRNRHDTGCTPSPELLRFRNPPAMLGMDAQHDDCWAHPEQYLAIIEAYYGADLLAQTR